MATDERPSPIFIFFVEEVWRFPNHDELAVSGRLVHGYVPGPCDGVARLTDDSEIALKVLGVAKARTSRLERAVTLRVSSHEEASNLRGCFLFGYTEQEGSK